MSLAIKKDVSGKGVQRWMANADQPIQLGYLTNVEYRDKNKDEEFSPQLVFDFQDRDKKRQLRSVHFSVDYFHEKVDYMTENLQNKIKHIFTAFTNDYEYVLGNSKSYKKINDSDERSKIDEINKKNFEIFFKQIVEDFNNYKGEGKVYEDKLCWLLIVIDTRNDYPTLPWEPDFIELYQEGVPPSLQVDKTKHQLVQSGGKMKGASGGAGASAIESTTFPTQDVPQIP